jgi:hypothetical protein
MYQLVRASTKKQLEETVNALIKQGWSVQEGLAAVPVGKEFSSEGLIYLQPMILPDKTAPSDIIAK